MKYSLIFAATAAAYDAYGGYGEDSKSSAVVKPSSSVKPVGYTTIYPGYDKQPVTVTTQYQPYPTCVSAGYDGKSCDKWEDDSYVSTTIKDCDGKDVTITKTTQPVTVYHTKKTITHSATGKYNGYATPTQGYAAPTGTAYKNGTEGCWYELYEKIEEVPYNKLGPHALPGYPGSGLYKEGDSKQPVNVKEYKGGKWSEYQHEYSYGTPKDEVTTYEKPGVYTVPAKDVTVDYPVTHPAEATKTAKAGETCTYGGQYVEAKQTGYVTGAYAAYETQYNGDKTLTETVIKYTTIYASTTGQYEVAKPTTTVYDHDTEVAYPTAKSYEAGIYHYGAQVVTITKSGEPYTCKYEQTKKYEPTSVPKYGQDYPASPKSTPAHDDSYGYKPNASATPKKPTESGEGYPAYPTYPAKGNTTYGHGHDSYPSPSPVHGGDYGNGYEAKSSPVAVSSKPYSPNDYDHAKPTPSGYQQQYNGEGYPTKATSTPCPDDKKPTPTPTPAKYSEAAYGHPEPTPAKPEAYSQAAYEQPAPTPVKPAAYSPEAYAQPSPSPVKPAPSAAYKAPSDSYSSTGAGYAKRSTRFEAIAAMN